MSKEVSIHIKTRLWTPSGYDELDKTFELQELLPYHVLTIPLDPRGKSFVKIKLTETGANLPEDK